MDIVTSDEARHGVSAMEMLESGNFLINTYGGEPDYWNLKPPLSFAPMAAGFAFFGYNTFGLRIFSAVISFFTILSIFFSCYKNSHYYTGIMAAAIVITSRTFIAHHNARSGDADALFIFLYTVSICIVLQKGGGFQYAVACFLAALAFLTKSFHAGPLCLTIAIFFFLDRGVSLKTILGGSRLFLWFFVPIFIWGAFRYQYDGFKFLELMAAYDAIERLTTPLGSGLKPMSFIVKFMLSDLRIWLLVLTGCVVIALIPFKKHAARPRTDIRLMSKLCLAISIPLLVFTLSTHKLRWYAYPAYPLAAMLMAHIFWFCILYKRDIPKAVGTICMAVIVAFAISEWRTLEAIDARKKKFADPVQHQMALLSQQHKNERITLFLSSGEWQQSHVLMAKFAGNITLQSGNQEAYVRFTEKKQLVQNKADSIR